MSDQGSFSRKGGGPWPCPKCGSECPCVAHEQTLLGSWPGEPDPNHHTAYHKCACGMAFTVQWRPSDNHGAAVIDHHGRVLEGTPPKCCPSRYSLRCPKCGGWARHTATARRGGTWYVGGKPQQDMFYRCETCLTEMPDPVWGIYRAPPPPPAQQTPESHHE